LIISLKSSTGIAGNNCSDVSGRHPASLNNNVFPVSAYKMNLSRQTFRKTERLCSNRVIAELFEKGNQFFTPYFRVIWDLNTGVRTSPAQILVSIPKREIKKAVKRNLIRRRIKEAYRKNKNRLYECLENIDISINIILVFRKNDVPDYQETEQAVKDFLARLSEVLKGKGQKC
jgi:ribonuclease P protein component